MLRILISFESNTVNRLCTGDFLSVFCKIVLFRCVKTFVIFDFKGNVSGSLPASL